MIHFDRWWNPAVEDQATDRAYRIGQTKAVMVHKFVCQGTLEEKIDGIIREKRALANEILGGEGDGAVKLLTEMSDKDLVEFLQFRAIGAE
nr:DEAD/DEAH box helicase [Verrucomicrobium spinosum]